MGTFHGKPKPSYLILVCLALRLAFKLQAQQAIELSKWPKALEEIAITDVKVDGTTAYLVNIGQTRNLIAVDVRNLALPVERWALDIFGAQGVAISGGVAYVASWAYGVHAVDLVAAKPSVLTRFLEDSQPVGIAVRGGVAFVASKTEGLVTVDINNLRQVRKLATLNTGTNTFRIFVCGDRAYVAVRDRGLVIVDVADPAKPVQLGLFRTPVPTGVAISDHYAFVSTETEGVVVLDVANPAAPAKISRFDPGFGWVEDITVSGTVAILTLLENRLATLDISAPARPVLVGASSRRPAGGNRLSVREGAAFVSSWMDGLVVFDIENPQAPSVASSYPQGLFTTDAVAAGHFAFVTDSVVGLSVLDISDLNKPVKVGHCPTVGRALALQVVDNVAYVACDLAGLEIIDVVDPRHPKSVQRFDTPGHARNVAVVNNIAYVADSEWGLECIDLSDLSQPRRIGSYNTTGMALAVSIDGPTAYVADGKAGLQVLDISNPQAPEVVATYKPSEFSLTATDVRVHNGSAYVANSSGPLVVLDITDPQLPQLRRTYPEQGTFAVEVVGSSALTMSTMEALGVVDLEHATVNRYFRAGSNLPAPSGHIRTFGDIALVTAAWDRKSDGVRFYRLAAEIRLPQTLEFSLPSEMVLTDPPLSLTATASSGLPVLFSVVSGPAAVQRGQLVVLGAGEVVVRAEQLGDASYVPVAIERPMLVTKAKPTVTWAAPLTEQLEPDQTYFVNVRTSNTNSPVILSVIGDGAVLQGNQLTTKKAGSFAVLIEQAGDATYLPIATNHLFTIQAIQSLNWISPTIEVLNLNETYPLKVESSSGLPATFRVASGPALIAGSMLIVTNAGAVCVVAEQLGPATQKAATLTRTFNLPGVAMTSIQFWPGFQRGRAVAIAVEGSYAYVAAGGLQIFDISNPTAPSLTGAFGPPHSSFLGVCVREPYAYLVKEFGDVLIVDVSNPHAPVQIGHVSASSITGLIDARNNHLYVQTNLGVRIVDVSDPTHPLMLGLLRNLTPEQERSVQEVGDYAYVAGGYDGLLVFDVKDPSNPVRVGVLQTGSVVQSVQIAGHTAFIGSGASLGIVDVTQPSRPVLLGSYPTKGLAVGVSVVGHDAYVADQSAGVEVIDVSVPGAPVRVGGYDTPGSARGIQISGDYAFVADNLGGLAVLSVRDPTQPALIHTERTSGQPSRVCVAGSYAYLSDTELGLQILDLADPTHPVELATYPTQGPARQAEVVGSLAYVAADAFQIIDVSTPISPQLIASVNGPAEALCVRDNLVYAAGSLGLKVIDVWNPLLPRTVGSFYTSQTVHGIDVANNYAYLACADSLQIVDVSNPAMPVRVARWSNYSELYDVKVQGHYAYVVDQNAGLQVLDISQPATSRLVAGTSVGGLSRHLHLAGNLAYVAGARLVAFDLSQPANPVPVGALATRAAPAGIDMAGDFAYLGSAAGLEVVRIQHGLPQTLNFVLPNQVSLDQESLTLVAQASSGLPVSFTIVEGQARVSGDRLALDGAGRLVVRASQAGDRRFLPVAAEQVINVHLQPQVLSWLTPTNSILNLNEPYRLDVMSDAGMPVTVRLRSGPGIIQGTDLVVTNSGVVSVVAEQSGNTRYAPVEITRSFNAPEVILQRIGRWPEFERGRAMAVQISEHHAYAAAEGAGLIIFDISQADLPPVKVGQLALGGPATRLRVVGSRAYVIDTSPRLHIVDVANPAAPTVLSSTPCPAAIRRLDVSGPFIFLACGDLGLQVLDVSTVASPRLVTHYDGIAASVNDVIIAGARAYLAAGDQGLIVLDVHDPRHPFRLGSHGVNGAAVGVAVSGRLACVAATGGSFVIDISDPGAPFRLSQLDTGNTDIVGVSGNVAIVINGMNINSRDISDPTNPLYPGRGMALSQPILDLAISGSRGMIAAGTRGIVNLLWSDYLSVETAAGQATYGYASKLQVVNDLVYLADGSGGLQIIDVSQPAKPRARGSYPWLTVDAVQVSDSNAYLAADYNGLQILGVINPDVPARLGYVPASGVARGLAVVHPWVFVAGGTAGLHAIDLSDPAQPKAVGNYNTPGSSYGVTVQGNLAYVADGVGGMQVVNIAVRTNLLPVASFATAQPAYDVKVQGKLAYLATEGELQVVDIMEPAKPILLSSLPTLGRTKGLYLDQPLAWLASGTNGLEIIDVANSLSLNRVGSLPTSAAAEDVVIGNHLAFVAEGEAGLSVVSLRVRWPQSLEINLPEQFALDQSPFHLLATASSGATVFVTVLEGNATIMGENLIFSDPGELLLQIEQPGNAEYFPVALKRRVKVVAVDRVSAFRAWLEARYPRIPADQRDPQADADGDGAPNLLECVLGHDPSGIHPSDGKLPVGQIVQQASGMVWEVAFAVDESAGPVDLAMEECPNGSFQTWQPLPDALVRRANSRAFITVPISAGSRFIRAKVTQR